MKVDMAFNKEIKSILIQIICTQLSGFMYFNQIKMISERFIWYIDGSVTITITSVQGRTGSNDNEVAVFT